MRIAAVIAIVGAHDARYAASRLATPVPEYSTTRLLPESPTQTSPLADDVIAAAANLQSHSTSNVCNVAQRAALAAVSG